MSVTKYQELNGFRVYVLQGCSGDPSDEPLRPRANQRTGPPPSCPVKRKYLAETGGTDQSVEGRGHKSEGRHWPDLKDGDKASKLEEGFGLVRQARCCHGYEHLVNPSSDEPLALIKKQPGVSRETVTSQGPSTVQQTRPSVITHASSNQHRGGKAEAELNQSQQRGDSQPSDASTNATCDAVVEEHFRRSLGASYQQPVPLSVSESVDAHFAKALGDRWMQVQAAGRSLPEGLQPESADAPSASLP
ncbi:transcription cofactor vestigial-like protein 4 isoform X1 [Hemitrygon akajei]|uniref:transcription cofactor vestigial-like protein 4 isoform X1 n=1 Tax=Hemitrygon akajei TaxID=2704970 RepID=UPI003BFA0E0C